MSQNQPLVLVTEPLSDRAVEWLSQHAEVRSVEIEQLDEHIAEAAGLVVRTYTQVTPELLDRAPRLKVVGRAGVALDNIDVPACRARGVQVVHTPEANTLAVVDYTVRMIIELNRRFWPLAGPVTAEQFLALRKHSYGRFLAGLTLGMKVLYNDIKDIELDYPAEAVDKPTLYARSDVVSLHVPLTELTRRLIDAEALRQFKPGAQLINCARGACVVAADLAQAVRSGHISGAVIDCHEPEPPPPEYPLFGLGNVILTPHVAARVPAALEAMCDVVCDVAAVLEGRPPKYPAEEGSY
jgi:phosphoglycerate dehydrogenase-like enzyme